MSFLPDPYYWTNNTGSQYAAPIQLNLSPDNSNQPVYLIPANAYYTGTPQPQATDDFSQVNNYQFSPSYYLVPGQPAHNKILSNNVPQVNNVLQLQPTLQGGYLQPPPPYDDQSKKSKKRRPNLRSAGSPRAGNPNRAKNDHKYTAEINEFIITIAGKFDSSVREDPHFNVKSKKDMFKIALNGIDQLQEAVRSKDEEISELKAELQKIKENDLKKRIVQGNVQRLLNEIGPKNGESRREYEKLVASAKANGFDIPPTLDEDLA